MTFQNKTIHNNRGNASVLVNISILSLVILFSLSIHEVITQNYKSVKSMNEHMTLSIAKANIYSLLSDPESWEKTIADTANASLECFRNNTTCEGLLNTENIVVSLRDRSDTIFYTNAGTKAGIGDDAALCKVEGGCRNSFTVTWRPLCTPGNCIKPIIHIEVKLFENLTSPGRTIASMRLNTDKYNFPYLREPLP